MTNTATMPPIHPGEVLQQKFLGPLSVSQYRLARAIGVSPRRITEIVHGTRGISTDTGLRLARYFTTSERFWLNLQTLSACISARKKVHRCCVPDERRS